MDASGGAEIDIGVTRYQDCRVCKSFENYQNHQNYHNYQNYQNS